MDTSTFLPILVALGLLILPELRRNGGCSTNSTCASPTVQQNGEGICSPSVTRCGDTNVNLSGVRFHPSPEEFCPCRLQELQDLADNGYEAWRLDPVAVSARFMQNCFIDPCFRGYPSYLAGKCRCCDKTYVVLGVGCAGKMIFELCQPVKQGECGIWIVTRYGKYENGSCYIC